MRDTRRARLAVAAGLTVLGSAVAVLWLTRPDASGRNGPSGSTVERLPGDLAPTQDERFHYAPGSPQAVSERFLRHWFRRQYEEAAQLSTGSMRERCERNLTDARRLTPDQREALRQLRVIAEAAQFDFENALARDPSGDAGSAGDAGSVARREVRGVLHAHGPSPDGRRVDSRRGQVLTLALVDGAWRVADWTPLPGDANITVSPR